MNSRQNIQFEAFLCYFFLTVNRSAMFLVFIGITFYERHKAILLIITTPTLEVQPQKYVALLLQNNNYNY